MILDNHLLDNAFLVGKKITLADITLVCSLHLGYRLVRATLASCRHLRTTTSAHARSPSRLACGTPQVFEPAYRNKFPNVNRWFTTCVNQPQFLAIMGEVKLREKMQVAAAPKVLARNGHPTILCALLGSRCCARRCHAVRRI
eukprot:SAG31_NODE_7341_length_1714_cov_4.182663_3_plen_143_part_00